MVRWAVYLGAGVALLGAALVAIGYLLPVAHVASAEATFETPPADVFAVLTDVQRFPEWRADVSRVELLSPPPALRWRESGDNGAITFEAEEIAVPTRLRTRIADRSLPFGGTWTYDVTPSGSGTHLRITEHGEVYNPLFRVLSRFVFGHTATMEQFLQNLGHRLR